MFIYFKTSIFCSQATNIVDVGPHLIHIFYVSFSDNKYPSVYLMEPLPRTSSSETATFRWTSNEVAFYKCAVDDPNKFVDCGSGLTSDWTTPPLTNGRHTFYLIAKDEVGNTAPRISHSWAIGKQGGGGVISLSLSM